MTFPARRLRGGGNGNGAAPTDWVPKVDKNPFYRLMDIFNGMYKRQLKLEADKNSSTDCKSVIRLNFNQKALSQVTAAKVGKNKDGRPLYDMACGHQFVGAVDSDHQIAKWLPCDRCSEKEAYYSLEHEWTHPIFKSNPELCKVFCDTYAKQVAQKLPTMGIDETKLSALLYLWTNAFDDIRVNSLNEKIRAGSADRIWKRWARLAYRKKDEWNDDPISLTFAIALGVVTQPPQGEFGPLYPILKDATDRVRYRTTANMLTIIRWSFDHCVGALLNKMQQPQMPPQPQQQQPQQQNGQPQPGSAFAQPQQQPPGPQPPVPGPGQSGVEEDDSGEDPGDQQQGEEEEEVQPNQGPSGLGSGQQTPGPPPQTPSLTGSIADDANKAIAISRLMSGAKQFDDNECHHNPGQVDPSALSKADMSALAASMNFDPTDPSAVVAASAVAVDPDMQCQIDQYNNHVQTTSKDSFLTNDAKARLVLIDVKQQHVDKDSVVELEPEERYVVNRLRSTFFRSLGKQKAKRAEDGLSIDIEASIQEDIYPEAEEDIFEGDSINQGFCYFILTDMSGSMDHLFGSVCRASEMLKQSLTFPFVVGQFWGFRGGQDLPGRRADTGEVWLYRYSRGVNGYTGSVPMKISGARVDVPVECGGLTPMNTAIHVAVKTLMTMPSGMAKRLFLLTDGSPFQSKVTGRQIPEWLLRQFVQKEISWARQKGIQTYSLVIGGGIQDEECRQMFGASRFWKRTSMLPGTPDSVDRMLMQLVLENFQRYIRARG